VGPLSLPSSGAYALIHPPKVLELRGKISEAQKGIDAELAALKEIADDQDRIRKNIERAPKESETFKRYLKKFDDQETEIEKRQARIKELKAELAKQEAASQDYAKTTKAD
jgi:septal ring factor EnvC (AmiA/AmiB activator)